MERIILATDETRMYLNAAGKVCIRQINHPDHEDVIVLNVEHIDMVIAWLQEIKQEAKSHEDV